MIAKMNSQNHSSKRSGSRSTRPSKSPAWKGKRKNWKHVPEHVRQAWVERKIAEKHERRANDPEFQERVDAQAYELLAERVAIFGADWHVNCCIRLPAAVKEAIAKDGTDVLLLMLDKETS